MEVRGYESVANVIDVMTDDQHCNSCALGKAKMPATPTGKTVRPNRKVVNTKMYIDLSGYIEETSIYHGFHYYISVVTVEVYPYFRELRLKSQTFQTGTRGKDGVRSSFQKWTCGVPTQDLEGYVADDD